MRRVNYSFTAPIEDKILWSIVPWIPKAISPDLLTYTAVISAFVGGMFYFLYTQTPVVLLGVNFMLFINWLTDSIDGKVAIYRNTSRPHYGFYIDHLFDSVSAISLIGGIILSHATYTKSWLFALIFLLLAAIHTFLKTSTLHVFSISLSRVSPTDGRIVLVLINFIVFILGNKAVMFFGNRLTLFDMVGLIFAVTTVLLLVPDMIKTIKVLKDKDKKNMFTTEAKTL